MSFFESVLSAWNSTWLGIEIGVEYIHSHYVDLYYLNWLVWVFYPLILTFMLPVIIMIFLYLSSIFLHLYRLRHFLREAVNRDFLDGGRHVLCALWDAQGRIWHGYDIIGIERIPDQGPALLIYYHGAIPIDFYYLVARLELSKNRQVKAIGDRFLFKIPGFKLLLEVCGVMPGTIQKGVEWLNDGHLMAIAPGGVREAFFSDEHYDLLWGRRMGFAKIAIEAKVPIIPIFTQNCREAVRALGLFKSLFRWIYEKTRLPIVPLYGGFPVKLRTFIGEPIHYDPSMSAEDLALKVKESLTDLIRRHQRIPGNILRALLERFYTPDHCKQS